MMSRWFIAFMLIFSACTKKQAAPDDAKTVNLAIWGNYLTPELQQKFTDMTGIKINISNYSSNEELLAKIQSGASGIDVAVPSDYMVEIMKKLNLLQEIDPAQIPNSQNIESTWLKKDYDSENKYSYPYAWSVTGIAIHKDLYKGKIKSWKDFFNNQDLAGKLSVLDDVRETMGAALKAEGHSLNTKNNDDLKKAEDLLIKAKSKIKMFRSDTMEALVNKEVAVAMAYSTDALLAEKLSNGKIDFIMAEEGGSFAIDNMVILKGTKNLKGAHALINYMLSPEVNTVFVSNVRAGAILKQTREFLPEDLKNNPILFLSQELLKKFEGIRDVGEFTQNFDESWTKVKAAK